MVQGIDLHHTRKKKGIGLYQLLEKYSRETR